MHCVCADLKSCAVSCINGYNVGMGVGGYQGLGDTLYLILEWLSIPYSL